MDVRFRVKIGRVATAVVVAVVVAALATAVVVAIARRNRRRRAVNRNHKKAVVGQATAASSELARRVDERDERERCRRDCRSAVQPMSCLDRCQMGRRPGRA